mmetsp:Transcript_12200/g.17661  ORF Transcript_12200/g.17661 Transcript_12200/m.17661 type:complete len:108 (-) Transcript_12200:147-470(-)
MDTLSSLPQRLPMPLLQWQVRIFWDDQFVLTLQQADTVDSEEEEAVDAEEDEEADAVEVVMEEDVEEEDVEEGEEVDVGQAQVSPRRADQLQLFRETRSHLIKSAPD